MEHHFAVGDRVQLIVPRGPIMAGHLGTIIHLYGPGFCGVQFDGESAIRVVICDDLVAAPPARSVGGTDTTRSDDAGTDA